jgi:hypothetical protein
VFKLTLPQPNYGNVNYQTMPVQKQTTHSTSVEPSKVQNPYLRKIVDHATDEDVPKPEQRRKSTKADMTVEKATKLATPQ